MSCGGLFWGWQTTRKITIHYCDEITKGNNNQRHVNVFGGQTPVDQCTFGSQSLWFDVLFGFHFEFIDALLGFHLKSSMYFAILSQIIDALLGFRVASSMYFRFQSAFIDVLLGCRCGWSMYFMDSSWFHRCTFGLSPQFHRCTFGFSAQLIDVLLDFHLNSSMHFAFLDSYHRCTWGLEVHWWMLVHFDNPSSHTLMTWPNAHLVHSWLALRVSGACLLQGLLAGGPGHFGHWWWNQIWKLASMYPEARGALILGVLEWCCWWNQRNQSRKSTSHLTWCKVNAPGGSGYIDDLSCFESLHQCCKRDWTCTSAGFVELWSFAQAELKRQGVSFLAGIACQFLTVDVVAVIATRMAPLCQMIERLQSRVKAKQEGDVKKEDGPLTPSPSKKLATDMEKKLKNVTGDTRLVKESQCTLEQVLC